MIPSFRLALRRLARSPGFAGTAVATLALCLAANLAIYAFVDAVLLRPLPFPESGRLVQVGNGYAKIHLPPGGASIPNYFDRRDSVPAFESVSIYEEANLVVGRAGSTQRVSILKVSPEFLRTLRVPLALGHGFGDDALDLGPDRVAILTDGFWRSYFQADPAVVGRTFLNDGATVTVIGVLPSGFRFLGSHAEFLRPASHTRQERTTQYRHVGGHRMVARLAPGATLAQAQAQLDALTERQWADDPFRDQVQAAGYHVVAEPLHEKLVQEARPMLVLLQCGALLLLLIGSANVAHLVLIRASATAREVAIRRALGAGRLRIALDGLAESAGIALGGSALGLLLGSLGIGLLRTLGADRLPLGALVEMDARVAATGVGAAFLLCLLLSVPALCVTLGANFAAGLHAEGRGSTPSRAMQRLRHGFIVAQVALAFVLLSEAGLLALSLKRVMGTPPGFRPENLVTGWIALPVSGYPDDRAQEAFVERLVPALRGLPGIVDAAAASRLPLADHWWGIAVVAEGRTANSKGAVPAHFVAKVTSGYWATLGIPLLRGRLLRDSDGKTGLNACVVDRAFADRYWPGGDPVGRRIAIGLEFPGDHPDTIVGVVADVKENDLSETGGTGTVYIPTSESPGPTLSLALRTALPLAVAAPMIRRAVAALDPGLTVDDLSTMQARVDKTLVPRRSPAVLALIFAAVAVALAAVGTYGALAYAVRLRRREIGVRMALGALPRQVLGQFLRMGGSLGLTGLSLGMLGAWAAARAVQAMLYGVDALHPGILLAAACVIMGCVFLSSLLPSRRAASVNPAETLRSD
jgi:predicted permease